MARIRPVLKALSTVAGRERKTFQSIATNNFFLMSALLLQKAGVFLYLVGALVVLFPLSADPLRKVPPERLALWPLGKADRRRLRLLSPWINPVTWLLAGMAVWSVVHTESLGVLLLAIAVFGIGFLMPSMDVEPAFLRWVPAVRGPRGQLVRKNLREMLLTLDFYMALILSLLGLIYRLVSHDVPGEANLAMTLLLVLALSSYALCLFGLESVSGLTRYQLMPVPGWRIIAAKDAAFLLVAFVLSLPLAPLAGLGAALAALAIGHASSVTERRDQTRWRFSSGASFGSGLVQTFALAGSGAAVFNVSAWILIPIAVACGVSARWYGKQLESGL